MFRKSEISPPLWRGPFPRSHIMRTGGGGLRAKKTTEKNR